MYIAISRLFEPTKGIEDGMNITFARLVQVPIHFARMRIIFIHLELWVAIARHNFRWVKILIVYLALHRLIISTSGLKRTSRFKITIFKIYLVKIMDSEHLK